jgi:hypothetical protein
MVVAWKGSSTEGTNSGATTLAAPLPGSIVAGDFLLMLYTTYNVVAGTNTLPANPSGWTKIGDVQAGTVNNFITWTEAWYRVATGSEGSTVNIAASSSVQARTSFSMSFTGAHATAPITAGEWSTGWDDSGSTGSKTRTHPSVTPANAGSGLVLYRSARDSLDRTFTSSITSSSGVERYDSTRYSSTSTDSCAYTKDNVSGAQSFTTTASGAISDTTEWSILIRPSNGGGAVDKSSVGMLYG